MRRLSGILLTPLIAGSVLCQTTTLSPPSQPSQSGSIGQFEIVGDSLVSAQQLFLGTSDKVYIVDKTERNPANINGHPAWASEYALSSNKARTMDIVTNSFCAGGNVMGDGTWVNVGGNQGVTYGGLAASSQNGGGPYDDPDGRQSIRLLKPTDDLKCDWKIDSEMSSRRWYPTIETLEDGSVIILGGCQWGGYVNDQYQDNPTYEFYPSKGDPIVSSLLERTNPINLYPLTWLLPSGLVLLQANWDTVLLNYTSHKEKRLDRMIDAVRAYPASAGTIMLPLTPANNFTATILFCGGTNLESNQWTTDWNIASYPASTSCVTLTPDVSPSYVQDDPLPEGRSMTNLIFMPDGKILCLNGAQTGTAGYGNVTWAIGQSFADNPVLQPLIYDPNATKGKRWSSDGLSPSTIPRMYHSAATLLPDGSIFVAGSNPNADYNVGKGVTYPTEYRVEKFYPSYYNERRPEPVGLPGQLFYGGPYFDVYLNADDLVGDVENIAHASVVLIRTGFSTHSMNMGQRYLQLPSTYTGFENNTGILHVGQLPPNPSIFAPGPALLFVVIDGVPSIGVQVMVGSGKIEKQLVDPATDLPGSSIIRTSNSNGNPNAASSTFSRSYINPGLFILLLAWWTL